MKGCAGPGTLTPIRVWLCLIVKLSDAHGAGYSSKRVTPLQCIPLTFHSADRLTSGTSKDHKLMVYTRKTTESTGFFFLGISASQKKKTKKTI